MGGERRREGGRRILRPLESAERRGVERRELHVVRGPEASTREVALGKLEAALARAPERHARARDQGLAERRERLGSRGLSVSLGAAGVRRQVPGEEVFEGVERGDRLLRREARRARIVRLECRGSARALPGLELRGERLDAPTLGLPGRGELVPVAPREHRVHDEGGHGHARERDEHERELPDPPDDTPRRAAHALAERRRVGRVAAKRAPDLVRELDRAPVALLLLSLERLRDDRRDGGEDLGDEGADRGWVSELDRGVEVGRRVALERPLSREELEQDDAESPDVGALVDLGAEAADLLGRHVVGRSDRDPRTREPLVVVVERAGQAEVYEDRLPDLRDEDVPWLQVAVEDPVPVGVLHGAGDLLDDREGALHG